MMNEIGKIKKINRKNIAKNKINRTIESARYYKLKITFIVITTLLFIIPGTLILLNINNNIKETYIVNAEVIETSPSEYISLEGDTLKFKKVEYKIPQSTYKSLDKREFVLEKYFESRNAPLMGHARVFVESCDKYGAPIDCISTAAIARHETDLCNYYNSADYFNCMGWGGAGPYRQKFSSFEEHIDRATDVLVNQYGNQYMDDPRLMQWVFCGPQDECIGWGSRILFFMRQIDDFSEQLGVGRLTDLRGDGLRY